MSGLAAFTVTAKAASLTAEFQAAIASEQHPTYGGEARYYHVSVNPENPGIGSYAATIVGSNDPAPAFVRPFTGPVLSYKWIGGTNNDISGIAVAGGEADRITYATSDTVFDGFGQQQLKLWTTTDPGADLQTTVADPFNVTADGGGGGFRSFGGAVTTVDISDLSGGSVYVFYGAFNTTPTVSAVMKDTDGGQPDIVIENAHLNADFANRTEYYVAELKFVNDAGYDVIEYTHLANGLDYEGNGRGLGTLLTGPPAGSSTLALTGFAYDSTAGTFDVTIKGASNTAYVLVEAPSLDFSNPDASPIVLGEATASVGTLNGNNIVTAENGIATVEGVSLGTVKDTSFIRVEKP
jgi:hypothetical protein